MLEMESYSEAIVGVSGKGLNIEQRKRLTIAVELAARPELLLFLDEPTSGLDSQTAWSICTLLRKLANNGQAILCTIHQPSSELFQSFDRLLLLKDGKQLYFGDIGDSAAIMTSYFERNGACAYTEGTNPAEWLLHVSGNAHTESGANWAHIWANSSESAEIKQQLSDMEKSAEVSASGQGKDEYAVSHLQQLSFVTYRIFQEYWRDPTYLYSKFALCAGAAFFDGFSFYMASKDIQGLTNILFSAFLLGIIFSTIDQQIIPRFMDGRALFEAREKQSKIYSWPVFVAANIIVEMFWMSAASVLVFSCWYYPIGLFTNGDAAFSTAERGGLCFFLIWLFMVFTPTLSQALAAAMDDAQTAVNVAQLLFSLSLIFCGVLVPPAQLPKFWKFMYRVSPATYLVGGLIIAGVANTGLTCSAVETLKIELPFPGTETCGDYMAEYVKLAGGRVVNPLSKTICNYCQMTDTNSFLDSMGIDAADGWKNAGIFSAYVAFNIAATFFFYWLARVPKGKKN